MINTKKLISEYLKELSPKRVLDLGCGNGKLSLRFANMGSNVVGVDIKKQNTRHKNFKLINQDIRDFKFRKKYDLIISSCILHALIISKARKIIKLMKKHTNAKGANFLICLSNKDTFCKEGRFYPTMIELKNIYSDWKMLKSKQGFTAIEGHDNLKPHKHNLIFLLSQKK